jgi:hypothetical protein
MIAIGRTIDYIIGNAAVYRRQLGGRTVLAFPDKYIASPLKETLYVIGVKGVSVGPRITDAGGAVITPHKREVSTTYFLNVYVPHEMGGDECLKGFDRWVNFLVTTLGYDVAAVGGDGMDYYQTVGSNVFKGYFVLKRIEVESQTPDY